MVKIYSHDVVLHKQVPNIEDYVRVLNFSIEKFKRSPSVIGAMVYGSVFFLTHDRMSDVDAIVVFDPKKFSEFDALIEEIKIFSKKLFVPLQFRMSPEDIYRGKYNPISIGSFLRYLESSSKIEGSIIKKNPFDLNMMPFDRVLDPEQKIIEMRKFLAVKYAKLMNDALMHKQGDAGYHHSLRRIFQTVPQACRNILFHYGVEYEDKSSERNYVAAYRRIAPVEAVNLLEKLLLGKDTYLDRLKDSLGNYDFHEYDEALHDVKDLTPHLLEFLKMNMDLIEKLSIDEVNKKLNK